MTVEVGSARWRQLVELGIQKDGNRNWFLGDAALEIVPITGDSRQNGAQDLLSRYADEIGIALNSLLLYRSVAHAWKANERTLAVSWTVHRILIAHKSLMRKGLTPSQAKMLVKNRVTHGSPSPQTPASTVSRRKPGRRATPADGIARATAELRRATTRIIDGANTQDIELLLERLHVVVEALSKAVEGHDREDVRRMLRRRTEPHRLPRAS